MHRIPFCVVSREKKRDALWLFRIIIREKKEITSKAEEKIIAPNAECMRAILIWFSCHDAPRLHLLWLLDY